MYGMCPWYSRRGSGAVLNPLPSLPLGMSQQPHHSPTIVIALLPLEALGLCPRVVRICRGVHGTRHHNDSLVRPLWTGEVDIHTEEKLD